MKEGNHCSMSKIRKDQTVGTLESLALLANRATAKERSSIKEEARKFRSKSKMENHGPRLYYTGLCRQLGSSVYLPNRTASRNPAGEEKKSSKINWNQTTPGPGIKNLMLRYLLFGEVGDGMRLSCLPG